MATPERKLQEKCDEKLVEITRFCVKGIDMDPGYSQMDLHLRLNGNAYWPKRSSDCGSYGGYGSGKFPYCAANDMGCTAIRTGEKVAVDSWRTLSVGGVEVDTFNDDEIPSALMANDSWHRSICQPYEIIVKYDTKSNIKTEVCNTVGAELGASAGEGVSVEGKVTYERKSCQNFDEPSEGFMWFVTIHPKK